MSAISHKHTLYMYMVRAYYSTQMYIHVLTADICSNKHHRSPYLMNALKPLWQVHVWISLDPNRFKQLYTKRSTKNTMWYR